jgi:predicted secreted protein
MNIIHGAILLGSFAIVWFLALFILLPIGLREDAEPTLKLTTKFLIAFVIAVVAWGVFYGLIHFGVLDV